MIAVEKREVVGRTYEEDDEELVSGPFKVKPFNLVFESDPVTEVETLVIGLDIASLAIAPSFSDSFELQSVGVVRSNGDVINKLLYSSLSKLLFVTHEKVVETEHTASWIRAIMSLNPKFVVGLGSLNISQFFGDREAEYLLRKVETIASSSHWSRVRDSLQKIRNLECGNVITGTSASLVTYCESRLIPALLLLTVSSASLSLGALKVFEHVWPFFQLLSESEPLRRPTNKEYQLATRANSFLSTTENMYC